ncbi:MAG: ferredoxin-type protein NapG [Gemmatimonadota bacterium]|nr:MAG: ferredoxin-type protein NapG [Gemmatimonadota bacterium]
MAENKIPLPPNSRSPARRKFLRSLALASGVAGAALLGFVPVLRRLVQRLRPPGAIDEHEFLAACIKCGQCVQVCPVEAIRVADLGDGFGVGAPYIEPREQACDFSCDGLQCVLACPTGALTHHIDYPHQADMAVATLSNPDSCLALRGQGFTGVARGDNFRGKLRYEEIDRWNPIPLREHPYDLEVCDLCVRQCPIQIRIAQCEAGSPPSGDPNQCPPEAAIRLVEVEGADGGRAWKPEILSGCVGCGVCEMVCPAEPGCITMTPLESRRGHA